MRTVNTLLNFAWTILAFSVVIFFWYREWQTGLFIAFVVVSLASLLVPLRYLQISRRRVLYDRLGVRTVNLFVQNGRLAKRVSGKTHNQTIHRKDHGALIASTRMYERFHWMCFVFFLLTTGYAVASELLRYALGLMLSNLVYNVYPILLQQYNRMRFLAITRFAGSSPDLSMPPSRTGN